MLGRLTAFGIGYVLGTRAGRGRYDTISAAASKMAGRLEAYSQGQPPGDRASARGERTTSG